MTGTDHIRSASGRLLALSRSRRLRRIAISIAAVLLVYTFFGFFGLPMILRHVLTTQVAAGLKRPVTVGNISFNPYSLRLNVDKLHVGERDSPESFVDLGHLNVKASWSSLFRFAPVVAEAHLRAPVIHVVRTAPNRFNFSDLLEPKPGAPPKPASSKPQRFAVSNIEIREGTVYFDDRVVGRKHTIDKIGIGVPFIANLPKDVAIYEQPRVEMEIDGSPLRLVGTARPFNSEPESELAFNLSALQLSSYLVYSPRKLPIALPQGTLSASLLIHFVQAVSGPSVRIGGVVRLDAIDVRDAANSPLAGLKEMAVNIDDLEPFQHIFHLGTITVDGLDSFLVLNKDGTNNLSAILAAKGESNAPASAPLAKIAQATPASAPTPAMSAPSLVQAAPGTPSPTAAPTPAQSSSKGPMILTLRSFALTNSSVHLNDNTGAVPAAVVVQAIHASLNDFKLGEPSPPSPYDFGAALNGGGTIGVKGTLDIAQSIATADVALAQVDVPALQNFAQSILAAKIAAGKLNASGQVRAIFAPGKFNVHAEPAAVSLDKFEIKSPEANDPPVEWNTVSVTVAQADLAARHASVKEVRTDGIKLFVRRAHDGRLNLTSFVRRTGSAAATHPAGAKAPRRPRPRQSPPPPPAQPQRPAWHYDIASVALERSEIGIEDDGALKPVKLALAPLNVHAQNITDDFAKAFPVETDGTLNRRGTFKVNGTAALAPLQAKLRIATRRLDVSMAEAYTPSNLNAKIASALLTAAGEAEVSDVRHRLRASYRGNVTLGNVRLLDKLTNDLFARWSALSFERIDFALANGRQRVHVGAVALDNFYARIILNSDGTLNLSQIISKPQQAPVSLTHAHPTAPISGPAPAAAPPPAAPARPSNTDFAIGQITLASGHIKYTDNFIKPNYSANLTDVAGKVGAFGTRSTVPAQVALQGNINGSAPVNIDGSINPLAATAFLDIKAKAEGINLTDLTAYSVKYTGYPIEKGTLSIDVHYLLEQRQLTAQNHILLNQLTFGDKVPQPSVLNLPIRLAVAILKDANGQINLDVPVSGSLSDPNFSIGSLVFHALVNVIVKAVTSPFQLLASAIPGGGANAEGLGYVAFKPGYSILTDEDKKKLDTVVAVLSKKPSLSLTITGRVDPALDRPDLRDAKVDNLVKWASLGSGSGSGQVTANANSVELTESEYNKYLKRVYKAAKFPKPKNVLGLNKSLPPDEMKKLLATNMKVTDQDVAALAAARADAVRSYLSKKINPARLFITATKMDASGINDKGPTTRADLGLQ